MEGAYWGRKLFSSVRRFEEGTKETSDVYRSEESWAYDWFAIPTWNIHSPGEIRNWLSTLGLQHISSTPSIVSMENARTPASKVLRKLFGRSQALVTAYWCLNLEPNTMYFHALKRA
jgi:hypothetical protein